MHCEKYLSIQIIRTNINFRIYSGSLLALKSGAKYEFVSNKRWNGNQTFQMHVDKISDLNIRTKEFVCAAKKKTLKYTNNQK